MTWRIPLFKIYWDQDDIDAVSGAISHGASWAVGPQVAQLEAKLADFLGVKRCLTFNSGTSALHAVLLAFGIGPGDEVIVPSFTFIATANAPLFVGARPVFADIEEKTFGLDPADVEKKITPRTKAIIPIDYAGCPCRVEELQDVARRHKLILIEDAAEAMGAAVRGKKAGSFGDAAVLSFCQNKVITTGEGGAVATDSRVLYEKMKLIRSHGRQETADYFDTTEYLDYVTLGYNFRMSNLTAALGLAQLKKLAKLVEMRRHNARLLDKGLSAIKGVTVPSAPDGFSHVYQMYTIRAPEGSRDGLMQHLADGGIMSKVYFPPVHHTGFYTKLGYKSELPVTEAVSRQALTLPMYPSLTGPEIDEIVRRIADYFSGAP